MAPSANTARIAELTSDLAITRDAIRTLVRTGQAYSSDNRQMTRADLGALRNLEKQQAAELAQLKRGARSRTFGVIHP